MKKYLWVLLFSLAVFGQALDELEQSYIFEAEKANDDKTTDIMPAKMVPKMAAQMASKIGNPRSQFRIGNNYFHGNNGVTMNKSKAVEWFTKAANKGYLDAQYCLGYCYLFGKGVPKHEALAVEWYTKAAKQGSISALWVIGYCYEYVFEDSKEAVLWYTKAAKKGDADAQHSLGVCYEFGKGVPKDINQANIWYKKAAKQSNEESIKRLKKKELNEK